MAKKPKAWGTGSKLLLCCLCCIVTFSVFGMFCFSIFKFPAQMKEEVGLNFRSRYPHSLVQQDFDIKPEKFSLMDKEWSNAMKFNKIQDTILIGHHGLAYKYLFILEGGYLAMAKPVDRNLIFYPRSVFATINYEEMQPSHAIRMDREYQGWSELAACILDRILKFNRKPTIVGRYLDSSLLYEHDYSFWGRIYYSLPNSQIPVSMHAWVHGLGSKAPSNTIGTILTMEHSPSLKNSENKFYLEVSDVLVFDFLIDDHDRFGNHNWKTSHDHKLLVWDSGLAWNFGPWNADLDILCGTHAWNGDDPTVATYNIKRPGCKRICIFRNETIQTLRNFGPGAELRLGEALKQELEKDILHPILEYGVFDIQRSGFFWFLPVVGRFSEKSFYDGLDHKVTVLLDHVQNCINMYGEHRVLV